jgi:trehalose synthase-fused probable maltokinase
MTLPALPPWPALVGGQGRAALADALGRYAQPRRWFRAKNRPVRAHRVVDLVPLSGDSPGAPGSRLALLDLEYEAGDSDRYAIPLSCVEGEVAPMLAQEKPQALIAFLQDGSAEGALLVDGLVTGHAAGDLFAIVREGRLCMGEVGRVRGEARPAFGEIGGGIEAPHISAGEQTNSTVAFGDRALMKVYRQLTAGPNPELEMGLFLSAQPHPPRTPRVLGALSYEGRAGESLSLGIVHEFLSNDGDAWSLTLRELESYFERLPPRPPAEREEAPLGRFRGLAETLGRRTGELHLALGREGIEDPAFRPEPLSAVDRQTAVDRARTMLDENLSTLTRQLNTLTAGARAAADRLLSPTGGERRRIERLLSRFRDEPLSVVKTRIHGDLHLGQVLARGDDFVIIDFEGEPARPLAERRSKSSPLRDVMGMARSFSYAPEAVLRQRAESDVERQATLAAWAEAWTRQVSATYLGAYLATVARTPVIPRDGAQLSLMLSFHQLERVIYEIGYEINNRPDWVSIPLRGLARLVEDDG